MKLSKPVIQSFLFTVVGALPFLSALVLLPFYSNYLSTENFGLLSMYISLSLLFQILTSFGVEQYVPILINERSGPPSITIQKVFGLQLVFGLSVVAIALLIGDWVLSFFYDQNTLSFFPFGLMSVATGFLNGYFRSETTYLTFNHEIKRYYFANFFNFLVTLVLSIAFIHLWGNDLMGPMLGRLLSGVLIFILALVYQSASRFPQIDFGALFSIGKITSLMFGYTLLMWVLSYIDRFILTAKISMDSVAVYDFATKCLLPVEFVMIGLNNFILPRIYSSWSGNLEHPPMERAKTLLHGLTVAAVFSISFTLVGIPLIAPIVVKNSALYESFPLMGILGIAYLTRAMFSLYLGILMLRKEVSAVVRALLFSALIHFVSLLIFVPTWGVEAALWLGILSKVIMVLFLQREVRKRVQMQFNAQKLITYPLLMSLVFAATYFLSPGMSYIYLSLGTLIPAFLFTYLFFRKDLKRAYGLIVASSQDVDPGA